MITKKEQPQIYQVNSKTKKIYSIFFAFKIGVLILIMSQGVLLYFRISQSPRAGELTPFIMLAELSIIAALGFISYLLIPRYGNILSPIKAYTYQVILAEDKLIIKENKWSSIFEIYITNICAITYNGYLIFTGEKINRKFILDNKVKIKNLPLSLTDDMAKLYPGTQLYFYRLNLAFIDNFKDLKEKLIKANPAIKPYNAPTREFLFAYGTLITNKNTADIEKMLDKHCNDRGKGYINAELYNLGEYPCAVPGEKDRKVYGRVLEILDPEIVFPVLDEYENYNYRDIDQSEYKREKTTVYLKSGEEISAWVYFYNRDISTIENIESGDYLEFLKQKKN